MKRPLAVSWATNLLECLIPRDFGEFVVGDLTEEFLIQSESLSRNRAIAWFLWQAAASVPRLLVLSARRLSVFKSLGVAAAAYFALGFVEPQVHRLLAAFIDPTYRAQLFVDLFVGFSACACAGYCSTWIYRGSALPLAVIGTVAMSLAVMSANTEAPAWFQAAFLIIAPVAPITGGAAFLASAKRRRTGKP